MQCITDHSRTSADVTLVQGKKYTKDHQYKNR